MDFSIVLVPLFFLMLLGRLAWFGIQAMHFVWRRPGIAAAWGVLAATILVPSAVPDFDPIPVLIAAVGVYGATVLSQRSDRQQRELDDLKRRIAALESRGRSLDTASTSIPLSRAGAEGTSRMISTSSGTASVERPPSSSARAHCGRLVQARARAGSGAGAGRRARGGWRRAGRGTASAGSRCVASPRPAGRSATSPATRRPTASGVRNDVAADGPGMVG